MPPTLRITLLALTIPAVLIPLYLFLICPRLNKPDAAPFLNRLYAHRGLYDAQRGVPENSLTAFRAAVAAGYGIELDVRLTADDVPVVFHDSSLKRMCGVDGRVEEIPFEKLRALPLSGGAEPIPSLAEVLEAVGGRVPLILEIKMEDMRRRVPEKMDPLLTAYHGPYCVESFNPLAVFWYRRHHPEILRGQLSTHFHEKNLFLAFPMYLMGKLLVNAISRPDFIAYGWRYSNDISFRLCCDLFHCHAACWVVRSPRELEQSRRHFQMLIFENFRP